jgi:probable HAF family extracellular repeat protein
MALATLSVLPLFASEQYQLIDLGTLGEIHGAFFIDNGGQVVGHSNTATGEFHAVLWTK